MRRSLALILSLAASACFAVACASTSAASGSSSTRATVPMTFGIGNQHATMFDDPRWQSLGLKTTRVFVPWNAAADPKVLKWATDYVTQARANGVSVLVHVTGRARDGVAEPLPSNASYRKWVGRLIAALRPIGVEAWGVWNEANHATQPTALHPGRAASYTRDLVSLCRGCTIVAADVLVQGGPTSVSITSYRPWITKYLAALRPARTSRLLIGLHNYGDLIVGTSPDRTLDLIRVVRKTVPKARFWITESGGIAASHTRTCDERRQVVGQRRMFAQAAKLAPFGVERLYAYSWTALDCTNRYDSGLIRPDGTARPALAIVQAWAPRFVG
ncbi:MAG: hypothetical protein J7513_01680 [Solirubrobacteraceae bacterium]|nr:hypothetical protein [Solirubrobacteraceae bacterium]